MSVRALHGTARFASSRSHYLALALRNAHSVVRSLSTNPHSVGVVGPESPSYIEVPMPATRAPAWTVPRKGFVPKARNVLKNSANRLEKHTPEFLSLVAPEPQHAKVPPPDIYGQEKMRYKDQLAATRRRNLREGIVELHDRREAEREKRRLISERRRSERDELLARAQSDDVKYTLPTINNFLKQSFRPVDRYPRRKYVFRKKRYEKLVKLHGRRKTELIHQLYQNAHSFILTEAQLDEVILARFKPGWTSTSIPQSLDELRGVTMGAQTPVYRQAWLDETLDAALSGGSLPRSSVHSVESATAQQQPAGGFPFQSRPTSAPMWSFPQPQ